MAQSPITDDEWLRTRQALEETGGNISQAARLLDLKRETVQSRVLSARARGLLPDGIPLDGYGVKGTSTLYDNEGNVKATWVKTAREAPTPEEAATQVRQALEGYKPPKPLKTALKGNTRLACLVPLVDLHTGLRVWGKECGQDWDLAIAKKTVTGAYCELFANTPKVKKTIILGVGDLLHADNYSYQTGTPGTSHVLDVDGRYPKTLSAGLDICLSVGDLTLNFSEEIEYRILPGNHDVQSAIAISLALDCYHRENKRVTVDTSPGPHWATSWGKTMLAATHGDKLKVDKMPMAFAAMYPEIWGQTKWRHFFSGHYHREQLREHPGCTAEILGTPIPPDSYSAAHGFLSSQHVHARIYDLEKGEIMRQRTNIL